MENRSVLLTVLEPEYPISRHRQGQCLVKASVHFQDGALFCILWKSILVRETEAQPRSPRQVTVKQAAVTLLQTWCS